MRRTFSIIAFLFLFCAGWAAETDTALEDFNKKTTPSAAARFFASLEEEGFLDEPVVIHETMSHDSLCAWVWYWAAEWYYDAQDFKLSEHYALRALPLCQAVQDKGMEADCASLLGLVYVRLGDFNNAATYAKQCNKLDLEAGDPNNIASSYNTLAGIYMSMRQPKEAEKYILLALDYARKGDNPAREAVILGMASEVYQHLQDAPKTLDYATRAYEIEMKLGRTDKAAIRQTQRAAALIVMERYKEAEKALNEAIPVIEASGNYHSLAIAYNHMGDLLYVTGRNREGADFYNKALPIFMAQHDIYNEAHTRKGLRETLRGIDPEAALEHGDRFEHLRDSIYDQETNANLSQFAAEMENDILARFNRQYRMRSIIILSVVCSLFAILMLVIFLLHRRRQREQAKHFNELLREVALLREQERMKQIIQSTEHTPVPDKKALTQEMDNDLFLARAIEYINTSLAEGDISVEALAHELNMSISTLRRKMLETTGSSAKTFILAIQLNKAKELLSTTPPPFGGSIDLVANACGFAETNSFIRAFQRNIGLTPAKWRDQCKKQS